MEPQTEKTSLATRSAGEELKRQVFIGGRGGGRKVQLSTACKPKKPLETLSEDYVYHGGAIWVRVKELAMLKLAEAMPPVTVLRFTRDPYQSWTTDFWYQDFASW